MSDGICDTLILIHTITFDASVIECLPSPIKSVLILLVTKSSYVCFAKSIQGQNIICLDSGCS